VSESGLQADPDAALAAVRSLARQGIRVMLDGFGAGNSSLAALQRLPFSGIKLDSTLAQACAGAGAESRWVPALVQLVHAMQLEVHASGADTELQCAALVAAGCDGLQGRRLGSWMEDRALEAWITLPASQRRL
jgi:EAL domain-containing protein (putative c-di-GMP-specific phosphodiesterase class I)